MTYPEKIGPDNVTSLWNIPFRHHHSLPTGSSWSHDLLFLYYQKAQEPEMAMVKCLKGLAMGPFSGCHPC